MFAVPEPFPGWFRISSKAEARIEALKAEEAMKRGEILIFRGSRQGKKVGVRDVLSSDEM